MLFLERSLLCLTALVKINMLLAYILNLSLEIQLSGMMIPRKFPEYSFISSSVSSGQSSQNVVLQFWVPPRHFEGIYNVKTIFVITLRCHFPFLFTFLHESTAACSTNYMICYLNRFNAEQICESNCLLLSQMLKIFAKFWSSVCHDFVFGI